MQTSADQEPTTKRPPTRRRLTILVAIGALLCGAIFGFKYFWLEHPVGSGPAGPEVSVGAFQSVWSERDTLLIGLGDSITDGLGAVPSSNSYFNRIVKPVDQADPLFDVCLANVLPSLRHDNFARSGTTSIENLEYLVPEVPQQSDHTFGIVVMTTGGNDIIHSYGRQPPKEGAMYGATLTEAQPWIENYRVRLQAILDEVESRFPGGCEIFLGNIYDPTDGIGNAVTAGLPRWPDALGIHDAYNVIIADTCVARSNVHLVDIRGGFLGHGIYCRQFWNANYRNDDPTYWYWDNFEDPNNRGYDAIRRLFLNSMAGVLPARLKAQ